MLHLNCGECEVMCSCVSKLVVKNTNLILQFLTRNCLRCCYQLII